ERGKERSGGKRGKRGKERSGGKRGESTVVCWKIQGPPHLKCSRPWRPPVLNRRFPEGEFLYVKRQEPEAKLHPEAMSGGRRTAKERPPTIKPH
ncbi:hypothetical protein J4Q44_G00374890, partial [Coregonus suidteri]